MKPVFLVYLHGFNSSPASHKARLLHDYMGNKYGLEAVDEYLEIPQVPPVPAEAIAMLRDLVSEAKKHHTVSLAGSSLGGFYATCLAEQFDCKAVLVNPAVRPDLLLEKYLGENINYYTSEHWILDTSHIRQFRELDVETITRPERYFLMLQKGDETLDYRQAMDKYRGCPAVIEAGGDHSFAGFERYLERILEFCGFHG